MFRTRTPEILMVLFVVCVPSWTGFIDFQSARLLPFRIETYKGSPAYAALEDARELPNLLIPYAEQANETVYLAAGEKSFTLPEPESLTGLIVRQEPAVLETKTLIAVREPAADDEALPLIVRQQMVLNEADRDDWKLPTLRDTAKPLIEQALKERLAWEQGGVKNGVYMSSPLKKPSAELPQAFDEAPNATLSESAEPLQPVTISQEKKRPILLAGQIEMAGGLAYTGDDAELKVFRIDRDRPLETGRVWVNEGRFEIHVREAVGQLVAELRSREGELQGFGEIDLTSMETPRSNTAKINGIHVKMLPASSGARTTVVSAYSFGARRLPVAESKVFVRGLERELKSNDDAEFLEPDIDRRSTFVVRAESKNYWDTLMMSTADQPSELPLFPQPMIKALMQLSMGAGYELGMEKAVVWGRVVDEKGRAIKGAKVEIADQEKGHAIYFNSMFLPDRHIQSTTENGYFAFIDLNPGVQTLRTLVRGQMIPAQVIPVEAGKVSFVELQGGSPRYASIHVYDAFNPNNSLTATINVVGSEKEIEVSGEGLVRFSGGSGTMTLEVQGSSDAYEFIRVQVPRSVQSLNFPLVSRQWTQGLAAQHRVSFEPDRGVVIGYFDQDDFEVYLDEGLNFPAQNIVYFNSEGRGLNQNEGVRGGGFIMYNVPIGMRTITVIPKHSKEYLVRTLVAEPGVLNLLK